MNNHTIRLGFSLILAALLLGVTPTPTRTQANVSRRWTRVLTPQAGASLG